VIRSAVLAEAGEAGVVQDEVGAIAHRENGLAEIGLQFLDLPQVDHRIGVELNKLLSRQFLPESRHAVGKSIGLLPEMDCYPVITILDPGYIGGFDKEDAIVRVDGQVRRSRFFEGSRAERLSQSMLQVLILPELKQFASTA
jgi:hypothetical protein